MERKGNRQWDSVTFGSDGYWDSVIVKAESKDFCFWEEAIGVLFSLVFLLNTMEKKTQISYVK